MTQYELTKNVYNNNLDIINGIVSKSKFQTAYVILLNFFHKIEDLKAGLEALKSQKAFYSSQALSRIINEHFLVAFYIFNKTRLNMNDDCAVEYQQHYSIFELIKRENYNSKLNKTYDVKKTPLANFLTNVPELSGLSDESVKDINKRANQFDVRNILRYIQEEVPMEDFLKPLEKIILNNCKKYNETSSYVHGGSLANMQFFENNPPIDKERLLADNAQFAEIYAQHTLSFYMLLLIVEDNSFVNIYKPIVDFMGQIIQEQNDVIQ